MTFRAPAAEPPTWVPVAPLSTRIPFPFGIEAVPARFVPMRLPWITVPFGLTTIPLLVLPEMTLPAPATVPPIVVPEANTRMPRS